MTNFTREDRDIQRTINDAIERNGNNSINV